LNDMSTFFRGCSFYMLLLSRLLGAGAMAASLDARADAEHLACPKPPKSQRTAEKLAGAWFTRAADFVVSEDFQKALEAFECSLSLVKHPATMLNTAKAAEKAGKSALALDLYKEYLDTYPKSDKAPVARDGVERLTPLVEEDASHTGGAVDGEAIAPSPVSDPQPMSSDYQAGADDAVDSNHSAPKGRPSPREGPPAEDVAKVDLGEARDRPASPGSDETVPPSERDRSQGRYLLLTGIALMAPGVTALVIGTVFQSLAGAARRDGEEADKKADWLAAEADIESYQRSAVIGFAMGGALVVGGVALFVVGRRMGKRKPASRVAVTAAGPCLGGRF
jgi:hypothetical protein